MYIFRGAPHLRRQQGFTLIELMITVAIIGVLAAIAIPNYQDYTYRARVSEIIAAMQRDKLTLTEYYVDRGIWPTDGADIGLSAQASSQYLVAAPKIVQSPKMVEYDVEIDAWVKGKIVLEAVFIEGVLYDWVCRSSSENGFPVRHLPTSCN